MKNMLEEINNRLNETEESVRWKTEQWKSQLLNRKKE